MFLDEKTRDSPIQSPQFELCCCRGNQTGPNVSQPPVGLLNLLTGTDSESIEFRNNIRRYNTLFSFASFRSGFLPEQCRINGPGTFRISGQVYHTISDVNQNMNEAIFSQIYIFDPAEQLQRRNQISQEYLNPQLVTKIQDILLTVNPYQELYSRFATALENNPNSVLNITMSMVPERNGQVIDVDQVAVILPGDGSEVVRPYEIVIRKRNPPLLQNISMLNPIYDPLVYVLLFPNGDPGFDGRPRVNIERNTSDITMMKYYRYQLCQRPSNRFLFLCKKLFEQYVVDSYAKIEWQRLIYHRTHQEQLQRHFPSAHSQTILPSTFVGGPRYMKENYQDSMAIVRHFGKPDLFVTMTCNKDWPEITQNLEAGQTAYDRPDIVARVSFHSD
jgi:hypothetical protein